MNKKSKITKNLGINSRIASKKRSLNLNKMNNLTKKVLKHGIKIGMVLKLKKQILKKKWKTTTKKLKMQKIKQGQKIKNSIILEINLMKKEIPFKKNFRLSKISRINQ